MVSTIKLKESNVERYSLMEKTLIALLASRPDKSADTKWLTEHVYKSLGRKVPKSSRIVLTGTLRSLIKKMKRNGEKFKLVRSPAAGPHSTAVRIES